MRFERSWKRRDRLHVSVGFPFTINLGERDTYAAPANQTDYSNLLPCYTFVGDGEPFYAETLDYVKKLQSAEVEAEVDVYHTDMHAFDMLRDDNLSREAIGKFEKHFEYALEHYV